MKQKPDLSIIIVSHNSHDFLRQTLLSLATQKNITYETIVVDNLSTDNTLTLLKNEFGGVKVIKRDTSIGFAAANNVGIKAASADTLLFMNPDISFTNKSDLADCYRRLTGDNKIACLGPRVMLSLTGEIDATSHRGFPTPIASFCHFFGLARLLPSVAIFNQYTKKYLGYDHEHEIDAIGGMFMMIKREAGESVGWWDETFDFYGEDLDLCYRLWQKNLRVLYYPAVTIKHFKGVTTGMSKASRAVTTASAEKTRQVRRWSIQAMEIFYRKHYQKKYPFIVNQLVYLGIKILYLIRVGLT
jgi:GT2 family glycosyltransferase